MIKNLLHRKKVQTAIVVMVAANVVAFHVSSFLFTIIVIMEVLTIMFICSLLVLNKLVKKTNWYKNIFIHTNQLVSNWGYRKDLERNYDIVNLGSNPSVFAFFYEKKKGRNWATGSQNPEMDLAILKSYHSYIKEGGIVLIPIVAFSSCSAYLKRFKPQYHGLDYFARFQKVLADGNAAASVMPHHNKVKRWIRYPLFYNPHIIKYLVKDVPPDNRHLICEQPMQLFELNNDADRWMKGWKEEFDIRDYDEHINERLEWAQEETSKQFATIVDFCKERGLKPILIFPPISEVLASRFSSKMRETYIYSFVRRIQSLSSVEFLDYIDSPEFKSPSLYFNSFFLNLQGRKVFTQRVLTDLKIE